MNSEMFLFVIWGPSVNGVTLESVIRSGDAALPCGCPHTHLKLFKLRLALQRAYSPEQPRVPAGQPNAGQWAREVENSLTESNYQQIAETCQEYIEANCVGKIYREFPRQFLEMDVSDLKAAARANEPGAKKANKLLFDNRFKK